MTVQTALNPYDVLRVSHSATTHEIIHAYQAELRRLHPDNFDWKDPERMAYAKRHFVRLSFAHDTLVEVSRQPQVARLYDFDGKDVAVKVWPHPSDNDRAFFAQVWEKFISEPYDWAEKSRRMLYAWRILCGLVFVSSATGFGLLFWADVAPRLFVFFMATHWEPFTYEFVPLQVGVVCAVLAAALAITAGAAYFVGQHPYSIRHSTRFKKFFLDRILSILIVPAWYGGVFGVIVGHYLF